MGERKVINKYISPDFDPARLAKFRLKTERCYDVRMMLPMSVQCVSCGEYMYRGKKFNSKKDDPPGENYLGVQVHRFTMKCTGCKAPFAIKTDPKNSDYAVDFGVSRLVEHWKPEGEKLREREEAAKGDAAGALDPVEALERSTLQSKREMEMMDALEEMRDLSALHQRVDLDKLIEKVKTGGEQAAEAKQQAEEREAAEAKRVFEQRRSTVKRLRDRQPAEAAGDAAPGLRADGRPPSPPLAAAVLPVRIRKRKAGGGAAGDKARKKQRSARAKAAAAKPSLLAYASGSDSDSD